MKLRSSPIALIVLIHGLVTGGLARPAAAERFLYDGAGRLIAVAYEDASSIAYTYDPAGNILAVTPTTSGVVVDADLSVTKTDGQTTVTPGSTVVYTIEVGNAGPSLAVDAQVTDVFPPELESCSWTCAPGAGAACTPTGAGSINDTIDLAPGGVAAYTATCTVAIGATGSISNTVTVTPSASTTDPNLSDNSATDTDTVLVTADLGITKSNGRAEIVETQQTVYTIVVDNAGPGNVLGAQVTDPFPPELSGCGWTCAAAGGGVCTPSGAGNIADAVDLPVGAVVTYTATCTVAASSGTCVNTATVTPPAGASDPEPSNDTATDTDHITALADFVFGDGFDNGDTLSWSATIPPIVLLKTDLPNPENQYRDAFRLELGVLQPLGRFSTSVVVGFDADGRPLFGVDLRRDAAGFAARGWVIPDDRVQRRTAWVALPHPEDDIELRWLRSLPGVGSGRLELYVDGLAPELLEDLDNDAAWVASTGRGATVTGEKVIR